MTIRVVAGAGGTAHRRINIVRRGTIYKQGYATVPAAGRTTQWPFRVGGVTSAAGLRLMFGNLGRGGVDTPPTAPIRVSATVLTPFSSNVNAYPIGDGAASSVVPIRVTFGGSETAQIAPDAWTLSNVLDLEVAEDDEVMVRTFVRSTDASDIQVPSDWSTAFEANSYDCAGDATEDMTATKLALSQHFIYTPMAVLAEAWA